MTDFIGTNEQLCNALNHIETRASTGHTDIIVVAAAQARIAELTEALKLADGMLSGANMNRAVVERKVRAALET
tara:strand:+ start:141 stop:362 length:222 start_codon:yes stop_codon:yes gene_type:complete